MTKDEALKLALGALESIEWHNGGWGLDPDLVETAITAIKELLTQPSQEHVAWMYDDDNKLIPLFTAPPQRPWVGLTLDEIVQIGVATGLERAAVDMISNKLKEKNI